MHLKIEKNVPQINKLEPKRPPKVASGEGQQHSAPEMSNNMSWPEMEPLCGGRQTYEETYVKSKINSGGRSEGSKMHTFFGSISGTENSHFLVLQHTCFAVAGRNAAKEKLGSSPESCF